MLGTRVSDRTELEGDKDFPLDGLADDNAFRSLLREHHIESMHTSEASLDDVFIDVTGRNLE